MSVKIKALDSIVYYLNSNPNIKAFVYNDNTLSRDISCNIKTDLVGTETTFIVQSQGDDLTSIEFPNLLLYRYLEFNGETRQIIQYDNTTGSVTIDSSFGFEIVSTDELTIKSLDEIFVYEANSFNDRNGTTSAQKSYMPTYFRISTIDDRKGIRNEIIKEEIKSTFYDNKNALKIYEDTNFNTNKGFVYSGNSTFNENTLDIKNNDYVSLLNVLLCYYTENK